MRCLPVIFMGLLTITAVSCATTPINELPMYGGREKSPQMLSADEQFIQASIAQAGSREVASREASKIGWSYYYQDDLSTAMKRFNQAWLLDQNNPEAYWGFGLVLDKKGQYDESLKMLETAYNMDPNNARIVGDYALGLALEGRSYILIKTSEADQLLTRSEQLFQKATEGEPDYPLLYANWAVALYYHRKYAESWLKVCKAIELGGEKWVDQSFVRRLKRKMPCPCEN